jgi:carboxyl-terminal processing protease
MSRRTRVLVFLVSTPLVVIVAVGGLLGAVASPAQRAMSHLNVFADVVRLILTAYVEPPNVDKVMDGAMKGLVDGLDPDTSYLTPDEVRMFEAHAPLPEGDIGVIVSRQYYLRIVGVRDGSPAQRAGLESGDFIRAIDGTATRDMSEFAGTRLLRGAPGSKVTLLVIRNGNTGDPRPVDVVREVSKPDRASGRRLPGGEALVRVSSFGPGAATAIHSAITSLGTAADSGVVVDLRDVADGTPEEAIAAARLFVSSGTIAIRAGRPPATEDVKTDGAPAPPAIPPIPDDAIRSTAGSGDGALTMPVILLVSNGTAHAAEVFAAALADNHRARLVGEPTAGLAGVQRLVKLPEGHGLLLTTERYLHANGVPIQGRGLRPDVPVEIPSVGFDETPPSTDPVLERGVQELKKPLPPATSAAKPADPAKAASDGGPRGIEAAPLAPPGSQDPNGPVRR